MIRWRRWQFGGDNIACLSLVVLIAVLTGCSPWLGGQQTKTTPSIDKSAASPQGWITILSGMRFTDAYGAIGLVASAARPGRIAGCGLAAPAGKAAIPTFVFSDDSGRTWHISPIKGAQATKGCYLFADTQQPDTFAAVTELDSGSVSLAVTNDVGRTWHRLAIPTEFGFGMDPAGNHLVGGEFFALIHPKGSSDFHVVETSIGGTGWRTLDETLPTAVWDRSQLAFAVDPDDSATLYAATTVNGILTIFSTSDKGATWHPTLEVPSAHRIMIWTAHWHQVFVEQLAGEDAAAQFYFSEDGGATWMPSGLHYRAGGESMYVGAAGHIVTQTSVDATTYHLFTLDPFSGRFSLLGTYVLGAGASIGVVVEGVSTAFIYAKSDGTYRLSLA